MKISAAKFKFHDFQENFGDFLLKISHNDIQFDLESKILFVSLPKIGILDV